MTHGNNCNIDVTDIAFILRILLTTPSNGCGLLAVCVGGGDGEAFRGGVWWSEGG